MIKVTINVELQNLTDLGIDTEGEDVECYVNPKDISFFYPSLDSGKNHMGTKFHFGNGEHLWCYEPIETIKKKMHNFLNFVS
jgi:hypothetical protein